MDADLPLTVAVLKVAAEFTRDRYEETRRELADAMRRGDRVTARDPRDDGKIAAQTLTDPKPVVEVNEAQMTPWMHEHYPELCETTTEVIAGPEQIKAVLFEHAPHYLAQRTRITREALTELKAACTTLRQVMGPGGETEVPGMAVTIPDPTLSCRLTDDARDRALSLIRSGLVEIDGTVRPAIEAP